MITVYLYANNRVVRGSFLLTNKFTYSLYCVLADCLRHGCARRARLALMHEVLFHVEALIFEESTLRCLKEWELVVTLCTKLYNIVELRLVKTDFYSCLSKNTCTVLAIRETESFASRSCTLLVVHATAYNCVRGAIELQACNVNSSVSVFSQRLRCVRSVKMNLC